MGTRYALYRCREKTVVWDTHENTVKLLAIHIACATRR